MDYHLEGYVCSYICIGGLFGVRLDPYGEMVVGDGSAWSHLTEVKDDAGLKAQWSPNATGRVSVADIKARLFKLRVYDKNRAGGVDKLIGASEVDMKSVLANIDEWVDVDGDLTDGKKSSGRYVIRVRYRNQPLLSGADPKPNESNALPSEADLSLDNVKAGVWLGRHHFLCLYQNTSGFFI